MRTKSLLMISLLTLLSVLCVYAQDQAPILSTGSMQPTAPFQSVANIPFAFTAGGVQYPAGQYIFEPSASWPQTISIRISKAKTGGTIPVLTRSAAAIHSTTGDGNLVFDKLGDQLIFAEMWVPNSDGYIVNILKEKHEHRVLNIPVSKANVPAKKN